MNFQEILNLDGCDREILRIFVYVETKDVEKLVEFLQGCFDSNDLKYKDEYDYQEKMKNVSKKSKQMFLIISKYSVDDYISFLSIIEVDKLKKILDRKLGKYDYKFILGRSLMSSRENESCLHKIGEYREVT